MRQRKHYTRQAKTKTYNSYYMAVVKRPRFGPWRLAPSPEGPNPTCKCRIREIRQGKNLRDISIQQRQNR